MVRDKCDTFDICWHDGGHMQLPACFLLVGMQIVMLKLQLSCIHLGFAVRHREILKAYLQKDSFLFFITNNTSIINRGFLRWFSTIRFLQRRCFNRMNESFSRNPRNLQAISFKNVPTKLKNDNWLYCFSVVASQRTFQNNSVTVPGLKRCS